MEDKKISRRDAMKLGQMGLLLGTGLGISSLASAGQDPSSKSLPGGLSPRSRYIIKFYRGSGPRSELVAWGETNYDLRKVFAQSRVEALFKFFRPTADGKVETLGVIESIAVKYER